MSLSSGDGGIDWSIKVIGVPFVVLWIHSLGDSIGGGCYGLGLRWGAGTCEALTLHILV